MKKEYFLFCGNWCDAIKKLPTETKVEIYEATAHYGLTGNIVELSPMADLAFAFIKSDIDHNNKKFEDIRKKKSEAGKKGNEVRWKNHSQSNETNTEQPPVVTCEASQTIANDSKVSQTMANDGTTSQSMANNGKISQSIPNDGKASQTSPIKIKIENKNINKNNSLSLIPSPSDLQQDSKDKSEELKEKEREDIIFRNLFWLNRKNPKHETQRLIDNYKSQGWKKANGREITDIEPIVRLWKCEEEGVRMSRDNLEFLRKLLEAVNLHNNVNALREVDSIQFNGDNYELVCTQKLAVYLKQNFNVIQPILHDFMGEKGLKVRFIK